MTRVTIVGLGEDSHRFEDIPTKPLVLAGRVFSDHPGFLANSDGDVIFHSLCHALASLGGLDPFLGPPADRLCREEGVRDSRVYLKRQLALLKEAVPSLRLEHVALSLEAQTPRIYPHLSSLRENTAEVLDLLPEQVGITATTGEGLSEVGRGAGIFCRAIITASREAI